MSKKIIAIVAAAYVLSVGTALASTSPFADVSPNDWSYGAVKSLAQAGLIDGYSDGTFKGDKSVTRYEMAQLVGKAMYRSDKANAEQKATIDKLATEFKDELKSFGVRMDNVEKSVDGVKDLKITNWIQSENTYGNTRGLKLREYDWEYRLGVEKQVSEKVHAMYQFRTYTGLDSQRWGYGSGSGIDNNTNMRGTVTTRQAWVSYQPDTNTGITIGKQVLWDGFIWDDFIRGVSINAKLGDKTNLVAATGRYDLSNGPYDGVNGYDVNGVINTASLSTKVGDVDIAAKWITGSNSVNSYAPNLERGGNIVGGLMNYTLPNGIGLQAGYAKNTREDDHNKLEKFQVSKRIGGTDVFVQYWKQDSKLHAPIENGDHMAWWSDMYGGHDIKGWRLITDTPVDKHFDVAFWYGDYKVQDTNTKAKKYGVDLTYSF
jgi:hypothetical protein